MQLRKLFCLLIMLFGAATAHGQATQYQLNPPAPNAQVLICPSSDNGYPCPSPVTVYSDSGLSIPVIPPIQLGPSGFFTFYVTAGTYVIQLLGPGYNASNRKLVTIGGGGGGAPTGAAGGDLSGTYPNPNVAKINGTSLAGLATGILKNTTTTGVPSIAVAADLPVIPLATGVSGTLLAAQFPALTGDITTSAGSLATTLSSTGASAASCGDATHSCSLTVDVKGRISANSNNVISAGGAAWSALTAPAGALSLSMAGNTSTFNTTTALSQFFVFKNTTAAVVGTSQGSPVLATCGRAFHGSADVEDCMTFSELPGNGNDAAIGFTIGHTGTSTGAVSLAVPPGNKTRPAYSFTTDINSGMYSGGSNTLGFTLAANAILWFGSGTAARLPSNLSLSFASGADPTTNTGDIEISRAAAGVLAIGSNQTVGDSTGAIKAAGYLTDTNCSNAASPAVCGSAAGGVVAVPTGTNPTLTINTTKVTSTSEIFLQIDESATIASTTCNTTLSTLVQPVVTARTAATSFTIQIGAVIATNPVCVSYHIIN